MLPVAEASSIPVPTALRPAGEIKVRKRRENRSSTSSIEHNTCSESDTSSLDLTRIRSSPPVIVEPDTPTLHRRKSSKNKVFSRVLGSIQTSRSSPGLLATRNGHSDGSFFRKLSLRRRPSLQTRSVSSDLPARPSMASLLTLSSSRTTLRADHSSAKSPPCGSPQQYLADQASPRPKDAARGPPPILTVDLNVMTECEALSLHEEKSVWVAVEARGVVKPDGRGMDGRDKGAGLDVVVVLDNSCFASPGSLETACNVALRIAHLSSEAGDRIAVFCTCCRHFTDNAKTAGCLLHPLKAVNHALIWTEIQGIKSLATRPPAAAADMNETLREAIRTLKEPTDETAQPLRLDRCHVFLLSPQPLRELYSGDDFSPINIIAVCTAIVPYHNSVSETSPIWLLPRTLSSTYFKSEVTLADSTHLINQATDLMSYARYGCSYGTITDLSLDISPRHGCTIENVLGATSSTQLKAGQTISALVRVKIPAVSTYAQRNSLCDSITKLDDAFKDLEILLGEVATEVLDVKARYRQSCFPENISMTVRHICTVSRPNPLSHWSIGPLNDCSVTSRLETELYQRFVFLIATQDPPAVALDALGTFYQNKLCSLPCSDYIERVRQELIYQMEAASLATKRSANASACSISKYSTEFRSLLDVPGIHTSWYEKEDGHDPSVRHSSSQPHFSFEARDSLRFTAHLPTTQRAEGSISASPLTDTHHNSTRAFQTDGNALNAGITATDDYEKRMSTSDDAESSSVDEARAIWRHMRRNVSIRASSPSRGRPSWPTGYRSVGQRQEMAREHRERELKKRALANKRSIGADTLRSMVIGSEADGGEAGAALWL